MVSDWWLEAPLRRGKGEWAGGGSNHRKPLEVILGFHCHSFPCKTLP